MRALIVILGASMLSGCGVVASGEDNAVKACETFIAERLRSPSTYKQITTTIAPAQKGKRFRYVFIYYDAANAYGTPVRSTQACVFDVDAKTGEFESADMMKSKAKLAASSTALREIQAASGQAPASKRLDLHDCCVADEDREAAADSF